jgi:hypothetical protein
MNSLNGAKRIKVAFMCISKKKKKERERERGEYYVNPPFAETYQLGLVLRYSYFYLILRAREL